MAVHGKDAAVLLDSFALTGYLRGYNAGASVDMADVTTFGQAGRKWLPGLDNGSLSFDGLWDNVAAATGQDAVTDAKQQAAAASVITVAPAGLVLGSRVVSASARQNQYAILAPVADAVSFAAGWQCDGQVDSGVALSALAAVTATGNGSSVDNSVSSASGGVGALHVTANTMNNNMVVKVQHSTNNSTWADLLTFSTVGTTVTTAERVAVTGTVNRYLRATWTASGTGSFTFAVVFSRR